MITVSFRHLVAYSVIFAVLFSTVIPSIICLCEGCYCEHSLANRPSFCENNSSAEEPELCCHCQKEQPCNDNPTEKHCCCIDIQKIVAIEPKSFSQPKKLNMNPLRDMIVASIPPFGVVKDFGFMSFDAQRFLLRPHVPLHVMLCVFLN